MEEAEERKTGNNPVGDEPRPGGVGKFASRQPGGFADVFEAEIFNLGMVATLTKLFAL